MNVKIIWVQVLWKGDNANMLKMYTKKGCADCMIMERKLENNNIEFKEVNIDELEPKEIAKIMQESGRKKMPILEKDGKVLDEEAIKKLNL